MGKELAYSSPIIILRYNYLHVGLLDMKSKASRMNVAYMVRDLNVSYILSSDIERLQLPCTSVISI